MCIRDRLDATLDLYGEMRSTFAPVLDAMAQMQVLERKMAAQPDDTEPVSYTHLVWTCASCWK